MILSELNRLLVNVANSNYLVNDAFVGDVYTINGKENRFGCFVATPMRAVKYVTGTIRYSYVMYYIDRLTKDEANIDFVQSDAVSVLKGILNFLGGQGIEVEDGYEFTLFRQKFSDWCAGAYVEVNITVADDDCGEDDFNTSGIDLKPLTVTNNGIYEAGINAGFNIVTVSVPQSGGGVTEEWVDNEIDLKLTGYATESWVQSQGYLTTVVLDGYATQSWVQSQGYLTSVVLDGYATQSWVQYQGYLTSVPSEYATKSWVSSQSYLTSVPSEYATQSWVSSQQFATETWVSSQNYLTSVVLDGYATKSWVLSRTYATEGWVSDHFVSQSSIWTGTQSQWEQLTSAQKATYIIALITE